MKKRSTTNKHVAQRTCLACRKVQDKRELIRLVRTPEGNIEIDSIGKKAGRGAYLCRALDCWERGLKDDRLEYALHGGKLTDDEREELRQQARELLQGAV